MSVIAHETRHRHGQSPLSIVTERCDGPGCGKTVTTEEPEFARWGALLGFCEPDADDLTPLEEATSNVNWCSVRCMKAWAAALDDEL